MMIPTATAASFRVRQNRRESNPDTTPGLPALKHLPAISRLPRVAGKLVGADGLRAGA
jgi:hypothetical protein